MRLADRVTASGERDGFFVIHRHAREGFAHLRSRLHRVGLAVDAFGIDVDEAHLHGGKRVFHRRRFIDVFITTITRREPFLLGAPIGVLFRRPDVFAAEAETEGLQTHGFISDGAREQDEVSPAQTIAVFLLDRPEQTTRLVEVDVVGP